MFDETVREALAQIQHAIWSHWMSYQFTQGTYNPDGTWTLPKEKLDRWKRQLSTSYKDLSEAEKESDRHQADKTLVSILKAHAPKILSARHLGALQEHHDYYFKCYLTNTLLPLDYPQLRLAMLREGLGLVKPLNKPSFLP